MQKIILKEEYQEEFLKLTKELIILSREEKGNISYHLYQDINDDSHFTFIEEWQNQEAIDELTNKTLYNNCSSNQKLCFKTFKSN